MKRIVITIIVALSTMFAASAQEAVAYENLAPGLYAIVEDTATPLAYANGTECNSETTFFGSISVGKRKYQYKGATADVAATGHFIMVIDPNLKYIKKTLKSYEPFMRDMTPELIMLAPLEVKKKNRIYDEGVIFNGFRTQGRTCVPFEWKRLSDTVFEIIVNDLPAGEYGFVFSPTAIAPYDLTGLLGFTVK